MNKGKVTKEKIREYLLKAKESEKYFTVREYEKFIVRELNIEAGADSLTNMGNGLEATAICADRNIPVGKRIGIKYTVNTYPEKVLAEVIWGGSFSEIFSDYSPYDRSIYPIAPRLDDK